MSHHDLINGTQIAEEQALLMRARLHFHGGKRRLEEGLSVAGVVALYDALLFGMRYFVAGPARGEYLNFRCEDLWDPSAVYAKLSKVGIFDDPHAFNHVSLIVERALWQESFSFDDDEVLAEVEAMLTRLGVMPFDGVSLPREIEGRALRILLEGR